MRPSEQSTTRSPGATSIGVDVDVDLGVDAERARHDRALRVRFGLLGREPALAHELLDEAVVVGELRERAVVQEVRARVADVADEQAVAAGDDDRGHRRAHARAASGRPRAFSSTASLASVIASLIGAPVRDRGAQRLDRGPRRDLAADVPAHAVGDREQREPVVDDERVLVVVADAARCRERRTPRRESSRAFASRTVSPICTWSPLRTRAVLATCLPFTNVPLVEPRSSTHSVAVAVDDRGRAPATRTCRRGSVIVQPPPRPIVDLAVDPVIAAPLGVAAATTHDAASPCARLAGRGGRRRRPGAGAGVPRSSRPTTHTTRGEEEVQQREEAELQDGEDLFGHRGAYDSS